MSSNVSALHSREVVHTIVPVLEGHLGKVFKGRDIPLDVGVHLSLPINLIKECLSVLVGIVNGIHDEDVIGTVLVGQVVESIESLQVPGHVALPISLCLGGQHGVDELTQLDIVWEALVQVLLDVVIQPDLHVA